MSSSSAMTRPRSIDWTAPFAIVLVLLLVALVLLPMFRLLTTSLTGDAGQLSLEHYRQLFVDPAFVKPLLTTLWTSAAVGVLCIVAAAPMAWLVSRTDLPAKRLLRALILASFVTPPFLGAFAWVLLGGPNAGLINQWYYALFGLKPFEATPLINIFSAGGMVFVMALYTFPYVFTCVAHRPRYHAAAGRAGAAGGVSDSVSAIDDAVRNTRDPGAAGRHRYDDHQDLELIPVSTAARIGRCRIVAVAAHHRRLVEGAVRDHGPPRLLGDRRQEHRHAPDSPWRMENSGAGAVRVRARRIDRAAVRRAGTHGVRQELVRPGCRQSLARTLAFRILRVQPDKARTREHVSPGHCRSHRRHGVGDDRRLFEPAQAGLGTSLSRFSGHRAGSDSRYRPRRRPLSKLHPTAFRPVRYAVDHLPRLSDKGASGRLSADRGIAQGGAPRTRGREPHLRRHTTACSVRYHDAADTQWRDCHLDLHLHRVDS